MEKRKKLERLKKFYKNLDEPVAAITPGQSLVLYEGSRVLGGGIIESARRARATLPILAA